VTAGVDDGQALPDGGGHDVEPAAGLHGGGRREHVAATLGSAGTHISRSTMASPANTRRLGGGWLIRLIHHVIAGIAGPTGRPAAQRVQLIG